LSYGAGIIARMSAQEPMAQPRNDLSENADGAESLKTLAGGQPRTESERLGRAGGDAVRGDPMSHRYGHYGSQWV